MLGSRPARSCSVGRANGERVVRVGALVIREQLAAVAQRVGAGVDDEVSGGREVACLSRRLERRQRSLCERTPHRVLSRAKIRIDRLDVLRPEIGHRFRIVRRKLRERFRLPDCLEQRLVGQIVRHHGRVLRAVRSGHCDVASATLPAVDIWLAAKRMLFVTSLVTFTLIASAVDIFTTLVRSSACDCSREMMSASSDKRRDQSLWLSHAFLPVLMTLMLRNRAGGDPWLTALLCGGCPLPSKKLPPSM